MSHSLFSPEDLPQRPASVSVAPLVHRPRLRIPLRDQIEFHTAALDHLLPADHEVRNVWDAVCQLDLSAWLVEIKAVEHHAGRDTADPRLLVALWVYATLQGEGSARRMARQCELDLPYRWLCGGVTMNYHTLADFRSQAGDRWDRLLTGLVASLMNEGLATLHRVAQDGMRVRASAGTSSFRRSGTLAHCLAQAREQVATLERLSAENPGELSHAQRAARERAAAERAARVAAAVRACGELQEQRDQQAKRSGKPAKAARASTTDPEARTMKFANGGFNPGYNVQFVTDTQSGLVVGVAVTNVGNDQEQLSPLLDQIESRYGQNPGEMLVDGGFAGLDAITDAARNHQCVVYAPLKDAEKQLAKGTDPYAPKKGDSPEVADWRQRMGTTAAKAIYRWRAQTAEWVNALCRNRGLQQLPVRGQRKCHNVALLYAIAHNVMCAVRLRKQEVAPA